MKQYESYKESGIEWLGQIPSHWNIVHIKNFFQVISGATPDSSNTNYWDGDIKWITPADFKTSDHFVSTGKRNITEEGYNSCGTSLVPAGSLIFSKRAPIGTVAISSNVLCTNQGCLSCVPFEKICYSPYYYYLFSVLTEAFEMLGSGSTFLEISANNFSNFPISAPPFKEQQTIAAYLDYKVSQIDAAITEKEQMLEDLKAYRSSIISETVTKGLDKNVEMKDSGIEWLGMIPQKWGLVKLKNKAKVNGRIGFRGYTTADLVQAGEGAYTIGGKHITNCVLDLSNPEYISWDKYYESPEIMVHKGDILMAQRGSLGKTALVREDIGPATINPSLVLLNSIEMSEVFLYYYLISNTCLAYIDLLNTATAVPMISQNQIENIFIPIPSHAEQAEIASFLDEKTTEINNSISLVSSQIVDLKAYKSAIITEAVTGKVDLRDWKPNKK